MSFARSCVWLVVCTILAGAAPVAAQNTPVLKGRVEYDPYESHRLRVQQLSDSVSDLPAEFQAGPKPKVELARTKLEQYIEADEAYRRKAIETSSPRRRTAQEQYEDTREMRKLDQAQDQAREEFDKAVGDAWDAYREANYWAEQKKNRQKYGGKGSGDANAPRPSDPSDPQASRPPPWQPQFPSDGGSGTSGGGAGVPRVDPSVNPDAGGDGTGGHDAVPGRSVPAGGGPGRFPASPTPRPTIPTAREAQEAHQVGLPPTIYKDLRQADIHLQYILGFQRGFNQRVEQDLIPSVVRITFAALISAGRSTPDQTQIQQHTQSLRRAVMMMGQIGAAAAEWLVIDLSRDPTLGGNPLLLGHGRGSEYFDQWKKQVDGHIAQTIIGGGIAADDPPQLPGSAANPADDPPKLPAPVASGDHPQLPAPVPPTAGGTGPRGPPAPASTAPVAALRFGQDDLVYGPAGGGQAAGVRDPVRRQAADGLRPARKLSRRLDRLQQEDTLGCGRQRPRGPLRSDAHARHRRHS